MVTLSPINRHRIHANISQQQHIHIEELTISTTQSIMKVATFLLSLLALALACSFLANAYDPSPLQDFCVATKSSQSSGNIYIYIYPFLLFFSFLANWVLFI